MEQSGLEIGMEQSGLEIRDGTIGIGKSGLEIPPTSEGMESRLAALIQQSVYSY
ncbi:MAG: hypothetical protein HXX20_23150 [Chloroflexi bacterium]|nr:hypothetical protein [Chloroflexota bacterium]